MRRWVRNHETTATSPILRLLPKNLISKIPGEQQGVVRFLGDQRCWRKDRHAIHREELALFMRAAVDDKIQVVCADPAIARQRDPFRSGAVGSNPCATMLEFIQ